MSPLDSVRRICIIGAGPAGLAALKVVLDSPEYKEGFWTPTVFESRDGIGGIWYPTPPTGIPPLTPLYDSMTTNIPHPIMAYDSYPFPPSTPIFPPAATVQTYLESYASTFNLLPHIQLQTTVCDASWNPSSRTWRVLLSSGLTLEYETVVVANGHFRVPRYPDIVGLSEWILAGRASHSAWYRRPDDLGSVKTVLVIGAGPSGLDISAEMRAVATRVIHSVNSSAVYEHNGNLVKKGRVTRFSSDGQVRFEDGSTEESVDHCILATGYQMSFPFFKESVLRNGLESSHIFPIQPDIPIGSLAFMGLLLRGTPLSLFEAQAHVIVKILSHHETWDRHKETQDIVSRYQQLKNQYGSPEGDVVIAREWHRYTEPESFVYRDKLYEFAGLDRRVETWEKEMWERKVELRENWNNLINRGEDRRWVEGIGRNGRGEWINLLRRILDLRPK